MSGKEKMRQPKFYLSLTIIEGNAGYFRPLLDLTMLIAWYYFAKAVILASKMYVADTIREKLYSLRQRWSDALALALGLHKIGLGATG